MDIAPVFEEAGGLFAHQRGRAVSFTIGLGEQRGDWEVLITLNGITVRTFQEIMAQKPWRLRAQNHRPILSSGRRAKWRMFRLTRYAFVLPARLPLLEELFLGRMCLDLEKPRTSSSVHRPNE